MSLRLISINVRGLREVVKRRAIFNYYRQRANIICLQETHSTTEEELKWEFEWGGDIVYSHGNSKARGVCILLQKGMKKLISDIERDDCGRRIKINIVINSVVLCICNIYAPNLDKPSFFDETFKIVTQSSENIILIGDFNLVMDTGRDRIGSAHNNVSAREVIRNAINNMMITDLWRDRNPTESRYSWYRCKPKLSASRIDFALISLGIVDMCENIGYTTGIMTDHLAHFVYFNIGTKPRGAGYWKLNNNMLRMADYVSLINDTIDQICIDCNSKTKKETWEYLKFKIRDVSREYSRNSSSEINLIISQLSEKVDEMQQHLKEVNLTILENTKRDLEEFIEQKVKGCIFRSKVNFTEMGEKPTKYFLNMEKARYNAKTCNALLNPASGKMVTETKGILALQENFYRSLYTSDKSVVFNATNETNKSVPPDIKEMQNKPFTEKEIAIAVKQLPNDKTCGNDGIPVDFYKVFWIKLKHIFMGMLEEIYADKKLNRTAMLGVINMIPKSGKDSRKIESLRPITLCNTDCKIFEKAIANRMEPAMKHIIDHDQRGFLKSRRISSNIRMIFELMNFTERNNISSFILNLDFQKCFDRIEFCAIKGALKFFGFAEYIQNWTDIMYTEYQVNTQNNGYFSNRISIQRGVRQGGPCSSLYFLICAEIMAIMLRTDKNI